MTALCTMIHILAVNAFGISERTLQDGRKFFLSILTHCCYLPAPRKPGLYPLPLDVTLPLRSCRGSRKRHKKRPRKLQRKVRQGLPRSAPSPLQRHHRLHHQEQQMQALPRHPHLQSAMPTRWCTFLPRCPRPWPTQRARSWEPR